MNLYDPNAMLSNQYSLGALAVTNQQLSEPNLPTAIYMYDNLVTSAQILEYLAQKIGPFLIISGFRTKELQNKLSEQGEPTSKGLSFHEVGRGFDISPTTMTPDEFFGRMLANPDVKSQFAEIAIKPSQNALHIATNVPGDVRDPKITGLTADGIYARLGLDQIASYIAPFMDSAEDAYDYASSELVTWNKTPLILTAVVGIAAAAMLLLSKPKRTA